jgi:hypothetical protein
MFLKLDQEENWAEEFGPADDSGHSLGVDGVHREEERRDGSQHSRSRNRKRRDEIVIEETDDGVEQNVDLAPMLQNFFLRHSCQVK